MAREAVGALASRACNAFARRVLRGCRGHIQDVQQGHMWQNFMAQHNLRDEDIEPTLPERRRVQPNDYTWMNDLTGGDYASSMQEAPLHTNIPTARLSHDVSKAYFFFIKFILMILIINT